MCFDRRFFSLCCVAVIAIAASALHADAPTTKPTQTPTSKPARVSPATSKPVHTDAAVPKASVASANDEAVRSLFDQLHKGMATSPRDAYVKCWDVRANCANALGAIWYSLDEGQRDRLTKAQLGLLLAPLEGESLRDLMPKMTFDVIAVEDVTTMRSDHRTTFVVKTKMSVPSGERSYLTTYVVQQSDGADWKIVDSQSDSPMSVQLLLAQRWSEAVNKKADPLASFEKFVTAIRGYTKATPM